MEGQFRIRRYQSSDTTALQKLYRSSVHAIGSSAYNVRQINAWSACVEDIDHFHKKLNCGLTLIAWLGPKPVSLGQLNPNDYIALLYTAGGYHNKGYASAIYNSLEKAAVSAGTTLLRTTASRLAEPFFVHRDFRVEKVEFFALQDVELECFQMSKNLQPALK